MVGVRYILSSRAVRGALFVCPRRRVGSSGVYFRRPVTETGVTPAAALMHSAGSRAEAPPHARLGRRLLGRAAPGQFDGKADASGVPGDPTVNARGPGRRGEAPCDRLAVDAAEHRRGAVRAQP